MATTRRGLLGSAAAAVAGLLAAPLAALGGPRKPDVARARSAKGMVTLNGTVTGGCFTGLVILASRVVAVDCEFHNCIFAERLSMAKDCTFVGCCGVGKYEHVVFPAEHAAGCSAVAWPSGKMVTVNGGHE